MCPQRPCRGSAHRRAVRHGEDGVRSTCDHVEDRGAVSVVASQRSAPGVDFVFATIGHFAF